MRNLLLFLTTAALTLALLDRILPPVAEGIVHAKLEAFAERADEYDLVLLGSSQSYRGFDPHAFDERTRAAGVPTRSFNFGVPGVTMAETHAILERIAELEPAKLRWVLIEAERVALVRDQEHYLTPKSIAWHDLATTRLLWPYLGDHSVDAGERWGSRWRSWVSCAYHVLGTGRGLGQVERWLSTGPSAEQRAAEVGPRRDGVVFLDDDDGLGVASRRAEFLARKSFFRRSMARLASHHAAYEGSTESARPFFARMERLSDELGARAVFFTIRRGFSGCESHVLARQGEIGTLLRFDDVGRFPALYDVELTHDGKHFDRAGAEAFTAYLADEFLARVERAAQ